MYNELYHYGIPKKSGRYPYGSGERPYQGEGGPLRRLKNRITKSKTRNSSQSQNKGTETAEQKEARKQKILASKNPKAIYKIRDELTQAELDSIIKRINTERSLKKLADSELSKGKKLVSRINKVSNAAKQFNEWYENFSKLSTNLSKLSEKAK